MTQLPFEDPPPKRGSRLSETWYPPEKDILFAESLGLSPGQTVLEADKFRDYWTALPGQRACKLDWSKTWRNWLRKDYANGRPPKPSRSSHDPESLAIIAEHVKRPWCERGAYPRETLQRCVDAGLLTQEEAEAVL